MDLKQPRICGHIALPASTVVNIMKFFRKYTPKQAEVVPYSDIPVSCKNLSVIVDAEIERCDLQLMRRPKNKSTIERRVEHLRMADYALTEKKPLTKRVFQVIEDALLTGRYTHLLEAA